MNLIKDPWIPVRRESGMEDIIAPWQLTETDDPVIALSAPRPDFNGALMQFLIGLLQISAAPEDHGPSGRTIPAAASLPTAIRSGALHKKTARRPDCKAPAVGL